VCFVVFCFKFYPTFAFAAKGTHKPEVALCISGENNSIPYILKSLRVSTRPYLSQTSMRSQLQRCFRLKTLDVLKFLELFETLNNKTYRYVDMYRPLRVLCGVQLRKIFFCWILKTVE